MRGLLLSGAGVLGIAAVAAARVELPSDLDAWAPGPVDGGVVLSLGSLPDGVLVGSRDGLHHLDEDGSVRDAGLAGPVHAIAVDATRAWVGTDEGLFLVRTDASPTRAGRHPDVPVLAVAATDGSVVTGSERGVHRSMPGGAWEQVWPVEAAEADTGAVVAPGSERTSVAAVATTARGVLFDHPEGLALSRPDGSLDVVLPGVDVVALGPWTEPGSVWVGTRGEPLLLVSDDGGLTWTPRAAGLGFSAVHAVAPDPLDPRRLLAGGSGLADGSGNAGTERSEDGGAHWHHEQGRLSNTHVFALESRVEPLRASLGVSGLRMEWSAPLPVTTTRWYAGTNGGGVSTMRPEVPVLRAAASAAPLLRFAEPVLAGVLVLACALPAYRLLRAGARGAPRPPPPATGRPAR